MKKIILCVFFPIILSVFFLAARSIHQPWHATEELNAPDVVHPSMSLILYDSRNDEQSCRSVFQPYLWYLSQIRVLSRRLFPQFDLQYRLFWIPALLRP